MKNNKSKVLVKKERGENNKRIRSNITKENDEIIVYGGKESECPKEDTSACSDFANPPPIEKPRQESNIYEDEHSNITNDLQETLSLTPDSGAGGGQSLISLSLFQEKTVKLFITKDSGIDMGR
ncbi:unnamed protein product [Lepeophtheirus salmonis]|uniref:(salmon louse) hypothetical protein n=1 Tax=Lepeophtheirus salmonis TaxID=72036 RepID=A0A7R8CIW7_LEPSM|nr:unnamed protein product [Lepeophtheirus salmonis]CAF2837117.1 unnamed protein product [Lepeophtheirus salmonis]